MFEHLSNRGRCNQCGRIDQPRQADIRSMIDDGRLQIEPELWDSLPPEAILQITASFFAGMKGRPPVAGESSRYAETGRYLLAAFEVGDFVLHFLTDHAHSLIEVVIGEE